MKPMAMMKNANQKFTLGNKADSYGMQAKGQQRDVNERAPKATAPAAPGKRVPPTPASSAVANKVQGSPGAAAKNPGNTGMGRKLGNHF